MAGVESRVGATVEIDNRPWRVYSAHAETRISFDKKLEQFKAILQDLAQYPATMPAVIMGDLEYVGSRRRSQNHQVLRRCRTKNTVRR